MSLRFIVIDKKVVPPICVTSQAVSFMVRATGSAMMSPGAGKSVCIL